MSYNTVDEALVALNGLTSTGEALKTDLLEFVKQVSVQAQNVNANATTVLYSGMIGDTSASGIIDNMASDTSIRTVDKTVAAKVLTSRNFREKVAAAFDMDLQQFNLLPDDHLAKQWLYKGADSPWVNVSERFVEATEGKVSTHRLG